MKISHQQKQKNRRKILQAATDIIIEKGLKTATMREIAKRAGMGDATIYNYFPTKESIIFAYYEDRFDLAVQGLKDIEKFNEFSFQEQLQTFFEKKLEILLPEREFVAITFKTVFFSMGQNYARLKPVRTKFIRIIREIFESAVEVGEIPDQVFQEITYQLYWDYYIGVVLYWLNDDSDRFAQTTLLIDKSLTLSGALIKAGIANKIFDMASFLFKNHVLNRMEFFRDQHDTFQKMKREFMGGKESE